MNVDDHSSHADEDEVYEEGTEFDGAEADYDAGFPDEVQGQEVDQASHAPWWRITAVGDRPQDHMIRDLIFGSLYRTAAPAKLLRHIRWYREDPPTAVIQQLAHLPLAQQQSAVPILALMEEWHAFLNGHLTAEDSGEGGDDYDPHVMMLRRLRACWPMGAMVEWAGQGPPPKYMTCDFARACPWCYARRVHELFDRLLRGPLAKPPKGRYLVQASYSFTPDMIALDPILAGQGELETHQVLREEIMDRMRRHLTEELGKLVRSFGMRDGLLAHRIVPAQTRDGRSSFRHELAALGTVDLGSPAAVTQFRLDAGIDGGWVEVPTLQGSRTRYTSRVLVAAIPASHPQALRYFLCGTSSGFDVAGLPLLVNPGAYRNCRWARAGLLPSGRWLHDGFPGTFGVAPLFLFNPTQWASYLFQTKGLPLFRTFGSWRHSKEDHRPEENGQPADSRKGELRRAAESLWDGIQVAAQTGRRGRPAFGTLLGEALKKQGFQVSRRELTGLVKCLTAGTRSSP